MLQYPNESYYVVMRLCYSIDSDISEVRSKEACSCNLMKYQPDGKCSVILHVITPK
jgi:hypothetical protein